MNDVLSVEATDGNCWATEAADGSCLPFCLTDEKRCLAARSCAEGDDEDDLIDDACEDDEADEKTDLTGEAIRSDCVVLLRQVQAPPARFFIQFLHLTPTHRGVASLDGCGELPDWVSDVDGSRLGGTATVKRSRFDI